MLADPARAFRYLAMQTKTRAWIHGFIGMLMFSGSLPATRAAVGGFQPLFVTAARASGAGMLALLLLLLARPPRPRGRQWWLLAWVAAGVVAGFPLLTALALRQISAARSLVFIGLLPMATAGFAVLLGGERPRPRFWVFAGSGALLVAAYALHAGGSGTTRADWLMLAAILVCGLGYAEGARLSRSLGGWTVICWALVVSLPLTLPLALAQWPAHLADKPLGAWLGLGYVTVISMLVGFFFWYRGLALGGVAAVSQLQLLQPFFGLMLAAALLGETVTPAMLATTVAVVACVAAARRQA